MKKKRQKMMFQFVNVKRHFLLPNIFSKYLFFILLIQIKIIHYYAQYLITGILCFILSHHVNIIIYNLTYMHDVVKAKLVQVSLSST